MKIRNGFVSNSSSSSFIVAVKGEGDLEEMLTEALGVPESSALYPFTEQLVSFLAGAEQLTEEEFLSDYGYKSFEEAEEDGNEYVEYFKQGYTVHRGWASRNESDDPIELMVGNGGLDDVETDDLIIKALD